MNVYIKLKFIKSHIILNFASFYFSHDDFYYIVHAVIFVKTDDFLMTQERCLKQNSFHRLFLHRQYVMSFFK